MGNKYSLSGFFILLTRNVLGFEQKYMYEILYTGPLGTSECAGVCRFSAKLCKRALDVSAGVIVQATRNAGLKNKCKFPLNVFVDASVSGRMTKQHLKTFFRQF